MRPNLSEYDPRYQKYLDLVPETDLLQSMTAQSEATRLLIQSIPASNLDRRFGPGEWTPREILGHILDSERIFAFRLLCFARGDSPALARADQDAYVSMADFERYPIPELLREFEFARQSHLLLLRHLPAAAWDRSGQVNGISISVRALAFLMLGHERHHLDTIQTQYLSLIA